MRYIPKFDVHVTMHRVKFLIIKPTICTNSSNLFLECEQEHLLLLASCQQTCMTYTTAVCTVKNSDSGQGNSPKHVEFHSKNKFEKIVHLVGFIIRQKLDYCCYGISLSRN